MSVASRPSGIGRAKNEAREECQRQRTAQVPALQGLERVEEENIGPGFKPCLGPVSVNGGITLSMAAVLHDPVDDKRTILSPSCGLPVEGHFPRFEYDRRVAGKGAHGSVRRVINRASQTEADRQFAIKTIQPAHAHFARNEVELLSQALAGAEHVVQLRGCYEDESRVTYLVLEAGRRDLFDVVRAAGKLPESTVAQYMRQVLTGVAACHQAGVAHRDLKLENLVEMSDGSVKLIDFGLSSRFNDHGPQPPPLGTVRYLAPEVLAIVRPATVQLDAGYLSLLGSKGFLVARDLWACGVILIEMALGGPLWRLAREEDNLYRRTYDSDPARLMASTGFASQHLRHLACNLLDPEPHTRSMMIVELGLDP